MISRDSAPQARLPDPRVHPCIDGPLGGLVLRTWFDRIAPYWIGRWIIPHQVALAAALVAGGSPARFAKETGLDLAVADRMEAALRDRASLALGLQAAEQIWESAFFAASPPQDRDLVLSEVERRRSARTAISGGSVFYGLCKALRRMPSAVVPPDKAMAEADLLRSRDGGDYPAPGAVAVEQSHRVPSRYGSESWLRFPAPLLDDTAWAHVYSPEDTNHPPTLIFLHGIAMETEFWADLTDPVNALTDRGIRVVRPEGPWHGRRRKAGRMGGAPALEDGVFGFYRLFRAWAAEVACLIRWARETSKGPVAVGGVSLGALSAQRMASAAAGWPKELQPDALFLSVTSCDLQAILQGSLARTLELPERHIAAGWTEQDLKAWSPLVAPHGPPCLEPDRIVLQLGREDDLTPFPGGLALAERWSIPEQNLFIGPHGHFSTPLRLSREPAPLGRLLAILAR